MTSSVVDFVVAERNWLPMAMLCAAAAAVAFNLRARTIGTKSVDRIFAAIALLFATTIGVMASGHFLAISILYFSGELSRSLGFLYAVGLLTALPAGVLGVLALRTLRTERVQTRGLIAAHLWLGATLLAMGLHNAPLAAPALANILYHQASNPLTRRLILAAILVGYIGLFVGSVVFMASGQDFEEFMA